MKVTKMNNDKIFIERKFKGESYKIRFLYYNDKEKALEDVTRHIALYVKAIKEETSLWVRGENVFGGKYGLCDDGINKMFEQGLIENKNVDNLIAKEMVRHYLSCKFSYIIN